MPDAGKGPGGGSWVERLRGLGHELREPPSPLGSYTTAYQAGELLFLSGMLPLAQGRLAVQGRLGADLSTEQGREAAVIALLNGLAVAHRFVGKPERIRGVVRLGVSLATTPDFTQHAVVADAASEILGKIFAGVAGHTRMVRGVQSLALGAPVALEFIFEVRGKPTRYPHNE